VREWHNRLLDLVYPVVFFDALRVKIRDEGLVKNKAVYVALALNADGEKDVLGPWIEQTEGAKFWLKVVSERLLRSSIASRKRAISRAKSSDISPTTQHSYIHAVKKFSQHFLIAVVDGLKGFPEAANRPASPREPLLRHARQRLCGWEGYEWHRLPRLPYLCRHHRSKRCIVRCARSSKRAAAFPTTKQR
jgi:hypothetical protein